MSPSLALALSLSLLNGGPSGPSAQDDAAHLVPPGALLAVRLESARALDELDMDGRAVLVMHDLEEYSMPEIAQVIDAPLNTLYSRLRLARKKFTAAVERHRQERLH